MQQLETISCDNCGAIIELPSTANYVTCAKCNAHLIVKRSESAHYTEVIAPTAEPVQHAHDNEAELRRMRIEMAIMTLDQEWEGRRTHYLVRSRDGNLVQPAISQALTYLLGVLVLIVYLGYMLISDRYAAASFDLSGFLLFLLILVPFIGLALRRYIKYRAYENAELAYLVQRDKLINERWENQKRTSSHSGIF